MTLFADTILVFLLFSVFLLLGSSRLGAMIKIAAVQGVLTGMLPLVGGAILIWHVSVSAVFIILLKGLVFPKLLFRAIRESDTSREIHPYVGYGASLFVGVLAILGSFWMDAKLPLSANMGAGGLVVPVAFTMMITGLFLMVARRTAMNQVVGYLVLENGIYTFGSVLIKDIPVLIELGVLMDVFVAVFVMGIAINRINREFDHIDADLLTSLKG